MYSLPVFRLAPTAAMLAILGVCGGCQKKPAPVAVPDVAAAQLEAQQEVAKAKAEARNGIKSATKIMGPDSKDVARAKITGAFDIAMTRADGNHKVADEKCLTLGAIGAASLQGQGGGRLSNGGVASEGSSRFTASIGE